MIKFTCGGCGLLHQSSEQFQGMRAMCLRCGANIQVPGPEAFKAPPAAKKSAARQSAATRRYAAAANAPGAANEAQEADAAAPIPVAAVVEKRRRPAAKKKKQVEEVEAEDSDETLEVEDERARPEAFKPVPAVKSKPQEPEDEPDSEPLPPVSRVRNLGTIGLLVVGALVILGVGYWFMQGQAAPAKKFTPTAKGGPSKAPPPPAPPPPPEKTEPKAEVIYLSAARLLKENGADSVAANKRYASKTVELRGHISRVIDAPAPKVDKDEPPPKDAPPNSGPTLVITDFNIEGQPTISCNIPAGIPKDRLPTNLKGLPVTIRATYLGDLRLKDGIVIRWQAPADDIYKGKTVELAGIVESSGDVKTLILDPFNTESTLDVAYFSKPSDQKPFTDLQSGQVVTLRGECAGRRFKRVELHNAQVLSVSTKATGDYVRFVQDYEADLLDEPLVRFPDYPIAILAVDLVKAYEQSAQAAYDKYHRRVLLVSGLVERTNASTNEITLESDTDKKLKVLCRFNKSQFERVGRARRITIRAVCTDVHKQNIVLENCMLDLSPRLANLMRMGPILLPEHFPFRVGDQLKYNVVQHTATSKVAIGLVVSYRDPGMLDFINDRQGTLNGAGLRAGQIQWDPKGKSLLAGTLRYRQSENFIEIGTPGPGGQEVLQWEPVLKLGARAGEIWTWNSGAGPSAYTVVDFRKERGQPVAVVKKVSQIGVTQTESTHVYMLGVGEIERTTHQTTPTQARKLVAEMLLVQN
jgi:tRNA_anti-like